MTDTDSPEGKGICTSLIETWLRREPTTKPEFLEDPLGLGREVLRLAVRICKKVASSQAIPQYIPGKLDFLILFLDWTSRKDWVRVRMRAEVEKSSARKLFDFFPVQRGMGRVGVYIQRAELAPQFLKTVLTLVVGKRFQHLA